MMMRPLFCVNASNLIILSYFLFNDGWAVPLAPLTSRMYVLPLEQHNKTTIKGCLAEMSMNSALDRSRRSMVMIVGEKCE